MKNNPDNHLAIEFYKIAVELHNSESERYWQRNSVFILVNGALLTLLGTDIVSGKLDRLIICIIGVFVSYIWWLILRQGKDLIERWSNVVRELENQNKEFSKIYSMADDLSNEGKKHHALPFSSLPASGLMQVSAITVMLSWVLALAGILIFAETIIG